MSKLLILSIWLCLMGVQTKEIKINSLRSKAYWKGTKLHGSGSHEGTLEFLTGTIHTKNGKLTGGKFQINMKSLRVTDIPAHETIPLNALTNHLHEEFDIATYPTATLVITSATEKQINGKLTIMGKVASVSFPYTITPNGYIANLEISRKRWGIGAKANWLAKRLVDDTILLKVVLVI